MDSCGTAVFTPRRRLLSAPKRESKGTGIFDNHTGLFRTTLRLNDSASKVLTLYLDPANDFKISIFLGKPGHSGVMLTYAQFYDIIGSKEGVRTFFKSKTGEALEEKTKHGVRIKCDRDWLMPLVKFTTTEGKPKDEDFIGIGEVTYENMLKCTALFDCLYERLGDYHGGVIEIYNKLKNLIPIYLPRNYTAAYIESVMLQGLNDDEWQVEPTVTFNHSDQMRAYFEIAHLCSLKLFRDLSK